MPVGFSKACRTCLTLDGSLVSIYDPISYDGIGRITELIKDITKIKPMKFDGLPELVCQTCLNEINRCYSFKVKCLSSDSTLRKLFATEEDLDGPQRQQVAQEEIECKPIIQNLMLIHNSDEAEPAYDEPPIKIKTEKDQEDQSFGYFVITSVCTQNDQTNGVDSEETIKSFQAPQTYIKEEIDYEIDSYNTSSTRRLMCSGDVNASVQSQCLDNISYEISRPQIKLEAEESFQLEPPIIENAPIRPHYKCPTCGKDFLYTSSLKKHMRSHNSKPFTCTTCYRNFKLSAQLRNHIDLIHRNINPFKCEECPRTFTFPSKLKEHLRSHRGPAASTNIKVVTHRDIKIFKCEECPRTFAFPSKLKEHLKSHKIKNVTSYYEDPTELATHSKDIEYIDEPKQELNYVTSNLDENIKEQSFVSMNEHQRSTRRSARIQREELKSPDSASNQIQSSSSTSEIAEIKVKTKLSEKLPQIDYSLDVGQDANPDEKYTPEGPRQFSCPHCIKVFKYLSRLNEHIVCHSDARPFDCTNCGKFFKSPGQLARHLKTSHKVPSFRTRRKAFSRRRGLKRKNVKKDFIRSKVEAGINSSEYIIENETEYQQTIANNTDLPNENDENRDDHTNEIRKDQSETICEDEQIQETNNSLAEIEPIQAAVNKNESSQCDSPSKQSKQIKKENKSQYPENLKSAAKLENSNDTKEISFEDLRTFHCEECDETFNVSARFYKHMRGHGIERPFICSLCGKGFKNCGNLKSHIVITHEKLKPFQCNDCKRKFSCKSNLKKHLISRIWTHSCVKDFSGRRRGGTKKKIKNKNLKHENEDLNQNEDTSKQNQEGPSFEHKTENALINTDDDKGKLETKCQNEEEINSLDNVQEPDKVGVHQGAINLPESEPIEVISDLAKLESEQIKDSDFDPIPNQAEETTSKNRLECPHCKRVFAYVSYLKKHMQSHSDERPFTCTICDKSFKYKVSLKSHNMITHAKYKPYKCDKCPQEFVNEYNFRVHRNSHNKANKRKTKSKRRRAIAKPRSAIVGKIENKLPDVVSETVAIDKTGPTSCSICHISIELEKLKEHIEQNHNSAELTCTSLDPANHSNQAENQSLESTNSFGCTQCNKVFLFASYLKKHMRCHNDERPHICSTCGKAFKDHWRLRSHLKLKHTSNSKKHSHRKKKRNLNREKPLMPSLLGIVAEQQNQTNEYLNIPQDNLNEQNNATESNVVVEASPETTDQSKIPIADTMSNIEVAKIPCTLCNRVFQFASQLETHMRTHTGERPYACPTCDKTFTQNGHLKNHVLINHKKIMPFQCSVCLRGFASGFNMRAHEKTHFNPRRKSKKAKSKPKNIDKLLQDHDGHRTVEQNAQNIIEDQFVQDFEKLELHPLFGSMSASQDETPNNEANSYFPCPHCDKTFVVQFELNEHMQTHGARPFYCSICYKTFRQQAHLKIHTQMSHTKSRNFKCTECDRVFLTFYILNKHMRSHKGKKSINKVKPKRGHKKRGKHVKKNDFCETISTNIEQEELYEASNEGITETSNISKEQIQPEVTAVRNNVQMTCALCSVLVDSDNLTDHMKQCLNISQSANIPMKTEPLEQPQLLGHPLFETLSSNQDEQKQTDTGIAKQCSECNEEFCSFSSFAEHMRIHRVERPFICTTCDKAFKKNAHLRSHIMIVHKRILPYKCNECPRVFSSKYNLTMHSKTHLAKVNLKKSSSKRRVIVKKSYYKDPPYHAKPYHTEHANPTTSSESQKDESQNDTTNYEFQNQLEQSEIQLSVDGNENKIRCTLCFISIHSDNFSKHMQEFHNLPESLTLVAVKKELIDNESEQLTHSSLEPESGLTETPQIELPPRLQCPTCDREFVHLSRLNEHMRAHSDERPFICLVCGKTFKRHGHLTTHIATCHRKAKPFKCKDCPRTFSTSLNLDVHSQTHIREQLSSTFPIDTNLQSEINLEPTQSSNESLPPFNLGAELIEKSTTEETHQCTLCPTVFKSISHLMEHMKVHTSDQPFICSLCGKGFSSNDDLITHRLIRHNKSKPYHCDLCDREYRTSLGLKKHHLLIHTDNLQRAKQAMRRKRQNTNLNRDPNNQESITYSKDVPQCHICNKNFTNNWVLKEHMKYHTMERPFICPICGHGFAKKYNLKIHIMAHKKIKPFKCHFCPQSYCTNSGRTHHMRTHTHGRNRIKIDSSNSENFTLE